MSCVIVWPATPAPVRGAVDVFADTVRLTAPFPVPLLPLVIGPSSDSPSPPTCSHLLSPPPRSPPSAGPIACVIGVTA
jgi:hypothetical protein